MHETSLIEFTLDAVEKRAAIMGIKQVGEIGIVVGRLAAVPELLQTAFDIMKYDREIFRHTVLHIDYRDIQFQCASCKETFLSKTYAAAVCPKCRGTDLKRKSGEELYIDYFVPYDTSAAKDTI